MTRAAVFKEVEDKKNGKDTTESRLGGGEWRSESRGETWRDATAHFIQQSSKDNSGGKKKDIKV